MKTLGKSRQVGEEGNTETSSPNKQATRKTFYCFTHHNYENDIDEIIRQYKSISKKGIVGFEICPTTGAKHLQGFIALKKPMRMTEIKIIGKPHLEACLGSEEQNLKYCSKENNFIKWGFPAELKLIEPSKWWQIQILEILKEEPDDRTVHWYWSESGGVGKSQFAKYCVAKLECLFFEEGKKADIMHLIFEAPEERLSKMIIDVPRDNGNNISYKAIESIKNGMIYSSKYEGGYKLFNSPHIIVFANQPPQYERLSADRWKVTQID